MRHDVPILVAALALLAPATKAEVPDGSTWIGGGHSVTVGVSANVTANDVTVTATDSEGTSNGVTGTPGPNSSAASPTVDETPDGTPEEGPAMTTPGENGTSYRAHGGRMQYKGSDGTWKNMRKKRTQSQGMETLHAGEPAPHAGWLTSWDFQRKVYLTQGQLAPYAGWFGAGDEVTSLPGPLPD